MRLSSNGPQQRDVARNLIHFIQVRLSGTRGLHIDGFPQPYNWGFSVMGVFSLGPPSTGEAWRIRPVSCLRNRTQRAVTTMKGTTITFPCAAGGVITPIDGRPTLEHLQAAVDGTAIEMVPGFDSIEYAEKVIDCVAFADHEAKPKGKPINRDATILWDAALTRAGYPGLIKSDGRIADTLCGQVAVVFGDTEFMGALKGLCADLVSLRS